MLITILSLIEIAVMAKWGRGGIALKVRIKATDFSAQACEDDVSRRLLYVATGGHPEWLEQMARLSGSFRDRLREGTMSV